MKNKQYKLIFMGTPDFAVPSLLSLIKSDLFNVIGVITQPDKKVGRKHEVSTSPVKKVAIENKIKIYQPNKITSEFTEEIKNINPDIIVVAAYGKILPKSFLDIPKYSSINIHASLLPKYRGASPIHSAILNGDHETGITIMKMNEKMDEGDIIGSYEFGISNHDNLETLHNELSKLAADEIIGSLVAWIDGKIEPMKQDHSKATYTKILNKSNGQIEWSHDAEYIERMSRAYNPWPGIFTILDGKRIKLIIVNVIDDKTNKKPGEIYQAEDKILVKTINKSLELIQVQPEGKKIMSGLDFARGYNVIGKILK